MSTAFLHLLSLPNAGMRLQSPQHRVWFDPFFAPVPGVPESTPDGVRPGDWVLLTHSHWDHLNVEAVVAAAERGARVAGPESCWRKLRRQLPAAAFFCLEPPTIGGTQELTEPGLRIAAVRTRHGEAHNSYLVEMDGWRGFNDADNEHTECVDRDLLHDLDAMFMCTWQGSGWVEFIESLAPRHWFLFHLNEEELDQCERGEYFDGLCDHVPPGLVVLRPGMEYTIERRT